MAPEVVFYFTKLNKIIILRIGGYIAMSLNYKQVLNDHVAVLYICNWYKAHIAHWVIVYVRDKCMS